MYYCFPAMNVLVRLFRFQVPFLPQNTYNIRRFVLRNIPCFGLRSDKSQRLRWWWLKYLLLLELILLRWLKVTVALNMAHWRLLIRIMKLGNCRVHHRLIIVELRLVLLRWRQRLLLKVERVNGGKSIRRNWSWLENKSNDGGNFKNIWV